MRKLMRVLALGGDGLSRRSSWLDRPQFSGLALLGFAPLPRRILYLDVAALGHRDSQGHRVKGLGVPLSPVREDDVTALDFVPLRLGRLGGFDVAKLFVVRIGHLTLECDRVGACGS